MIDETKKGSDEHPSLHIVKAPAELDVEELMREVRHNVQLHQSKGLYEEKESKMAARSAFGAEWVTTAGEQMDLLRAVARLDLQGEEYRSHRPWLGPFIVAWKKVVRFWVRKYTDGIFLRQSFFNTQVLSALDNIQQRLDSLEEEVERLRAEVRRSKTENPLEK
jgi:hypothetical protein